MKRRYVVAIATVVGILAGLVLIAAIGYNSSVQPLDRVLAACPTEDSTDCYWDASTRGNGQGTSFVNIDGTTYFLLPSGRN